VTWRLVALVFLGASATSAPSGSALAQRLDAIAGAGVAENRAVGITAAVARGKDVLLLKAYGKADAEGNVPLTVDTVMPIGSVTKQFTAAAIVQLRDQGKLGLDDDITKWLPDFQTHGNKVTLRHMLGHTSGIANLTSVPELRALKMIRNPTLTRDQVYKIIRTYPFEFATGTMEIYSNTNFWLLGLVIEKASGMAYEDYIEKRIFEPLGMKRSMYCNTAEAGSPRAYGHGMKGGISVRVPDIVQTATYAAGAICSTAGDMLTWLQALHGGKVLPARSYAEMMAPSKLADGTPLRYAMGTSVGEDRRGQKYLGHNGGGFGYSTEARWYPAAQLAVVVLTNSEPDAITETTVELASAVLPAPRPAGPFTGDAAVLVGTYTGPGPGGETSVEVIQTPQGLALSVRGGSADPLVWVEGLTFRRNDSLVIFRPSASSGPATAVVFDTAGDHFILRRQARYVSASGRS
jgi:CubicO group peptidase (beta-lactamase class C family)